MNVQSSFMSSNYLPGQDHERQTMYEYEQAPLNQRQSMNFDKSNRMSVRESWKTTNSREEDGWKMSNKAVRSSTILRQNEQFQFQEQFQPQQIQQLQQLQQIQQLQQQQLQQVMGAESYSPSWQRLEGNMTCYGSPAKPLPPPPPAPPVRRSMAYSMTNDHFYPLTQEPYSYSSIPQDHHPGYRATQDQYSYPQIQQEPLYAQPLDNPYSTTMSHQELYTYPPTATATNQEMYSYPPQQDPYTGYPPVHQDSYNNYHPAGFVEPPSTEVVVPNQTYYTESLDQDFHHMPNKAGSISPKDTKKKDTSPERKVRQITVQSINREHRVWIVVEPTETGLSLAEKIHQIATFRTRKILTITSASGRQVPLDHRPVFGSWSDMDSFQDGEGWEVTWGDLDKSVVDRIFSKVVQVGGRKKSQNNS